ncbi:MAG: pyruvate dehydrogenase complex E1 component subunit beta [Chitinispirillaceae bacterium]|nr:pyruvate dehydrogenase complex E1 component subunit beta [Chitinispirillaceae bacterium]
MALLTFRDALNQALDEEMERDPAIIIIGEEVAQYNGAYKVTKGLLDKYGPSRVIDTPITEEGFTGVGIGAAMAGMRVIVEWMTFNFSIQALDQVLNNAAKMRYMSGGQFTLPIVFRGPNGPAEYLSSQHSQALQSMFAHIPGLKVVAPSTPHDAKGLLKSAIRDDNPVVFLEAELMYNWTGEVPEQQYVVPIGTAAIRQEGTDVTIVSFSKPMKLAMEAAAELAKEDISAEVIDLRSLRPLDETTVFESVRKTNRCVIIDEAWPVASIGTHIGCRVSQECFDFLDAPVEVINSQDVPMPYNHGLELAAQPSVAAIIAAVRRCSYATNG